MVGDEVVGAAVLGATVEGDFVLGLAVVGISVVGFDVLGTAVLGRAVVGTAVLGLAVVGTSVVGTNVVGTAVVGGPGVAPMHARALFKFHPDGHKGDPPEPPAKQAPVDLHHPHPFMMRHEMQSPAVHCPRIGFTNTSASNKKVRAMHSLPLNRNSIN